MPAPRLALNSLRRKIVFAYGAIAALVVALSAFSLIEMRLLEAQILAGTRIGQFLGIALEIRRFEKNYFLYRQQTDLDENRTYVAQAQALLKEHGALLDTYAQPARIRALHDTLEAYAALMEAHSEVHSVKGDNPQQEARIRQAGKEILTAAEDWSRAEHIILQTQLDRHRRWLLGSIIAVVLLLLAIGQWLSWRVARPLKQLEENMQAVAAGRLAKLEMTAPDREIASLTQAFNHVLDELERRQGQLVRSEKLAALGTLLSGVAHELNNPLSNISTSCEILAEEVGGDGTPFQRELIGQIDAETWRARRIVRSLLDYARDREFHREVLQLGPLVAESLRLIKGQIPAHVSIETVIPAELTVSGDKQRLQQVLFNLVGNAVAALEGAGEVHIEARNTVQPLPADALLFGQNPRTRTAVEIEIRDNGHGIAAEILPRIFDPFFTTRDIGQGLGLGLFVVFEIVEEHGGGIAVRSSPGQGTSFLVRLPERS